MIRTRLVAGGLLTALTLVLFSSVGCLPQETNRAQVADDPEKDALATVGSKTSVGNFDAIPVSGVGIVFNLKGTGSSPAPDEWRKMLENSLRKRKLSSTEVKNILDDPTKSTSLVMVSAVIPRGASNGDKLDVMITLPQGSKTTSLAGGVLDLCDLTNYELAGNAREALAASGLPTGKVPLAGANTLLMGSRLAMAQGPLVAGAMVTAPNKETATEDAETAEYKMAQNLRVARIWDGATCLLDRPYYFMLNDSAPQPRLAMLIASRLNTVFHGTGDRGNKVAEAKANGRPMIMVNVPPAYRLNHDRFLLVARQVPLTPVSTSDPQFQILSRELAQPDKAITAALKLEALGVESTDALRVGLESNSPWVRFAAAQSLAYLGKADPTVAKELGHLAESHPALRSHALLALASQDDAPCLDQLAELMRRGDANLRYGAFTALRSADENHEAVRGRQMANSYWMHTVASESQSLVHLSTDRRNEIVLFGENHKVRGPFSLALGKEFTVTCDGDSQQVSINRVFIHNGEPTEKEGKYPADLSIMLKGLAELGGGYMEAIDLIRNLNNVKSLETDLAIDCNPRGLPIQKLVLLAQTDATMQRANREVMDAMNGNTDSGIVQASYDLPSDADAVKAQPPAPIEPLPLNRNPGSLFNSITGSSSDGPSNRDPGSLLGR